MSRTINHQPSTSNQLRDRRAIIVWLAICALLVAAMVLIGGYTRLSGSGLSITEWKPVHGTLPPMSDAAWQEEFSAYQASPQYKKVNAGLSLEEFKAIFWPEYIHRLLGRTVGAVFFLPLMIFAARHSLSRRFFWRLAAIFALGGLQGLIGWLMVASGLIDDPHVSPIRLALHLSVAFLILGMLLWAVMDPLPLPLGEGRGEGGATNSAQHYILPPSPARLRRPPSPGGRGSYILWFSLFCLQIIMGAFMAGTHAGLIYNTWPTMNGEFLPDGLLAGNPLYNLTMIQFLHRNLAVLVAIGFLLWWRSHRQYVKNAHLGKVCAGVTAIIAVQFALGVMTLLHQAPLPLALAHQAAGLALFAMGVVLLYRVSSLREAQRRSHPETNWIATLPLAARDDG